MKRSEAVRLIARIMREWPGSFVDGFAADYPGDDSTFTVFWRPYKGGPRYRIASVEDWPLVRSLGGFDAERVGQNC